jgi:hypothetical protein
MAEAPVYIVHLRRPNMADPDERRSDPFYEYGSFGCTGCHSSNLLHPRHAAQLEGARIAFAQGGRLGTRLVFLTPPITIRQWADRCEVRWKAGCMPFRYECAPILVSSAEASDFPKLARLAQQTACLTPEAGFASLFRSRAKPLDPVLAIEVIVQYERLQKSAPRTAFCSSYAEALPYKPPCIDMERGKTYRRQIARLRSEVQGSCARKKPRSCCRRRAAH